MQEEACWSGLGEVSDNLGARDGLLTPAINTSYFSSLPTGSKLGVRRGRGEAKEGRTRKSREDVEYSVNTGMIADLRNRNRKEKRRIKRPGRVRLLLHIYLFHKTYLEQMTRDFECRGPIPHDAVVNLQPRSVVEDTETTTRVG